MMRKLILGIAVLWIAMAQAAPAEAQRILVAGRNAVETPDAQGRPRLLSIELPNERYRDYDLRGATLGSAFVGIYGTVYRLWVMPPWNGAQEFVLTNADAPIVPHVHITLNIPFPNSTAAQSGFYATTPGVYTGQIYLMEPFSY